MKVLFLLLLCVLITHAFHDQQKQQLRNNEVHHVNVKPFGPLLKRVFVTDLEHSSSSSSFSSSSSSSSMATRSVKSTSSKDPTKIATDFANEHYAFPGASFVIKNVVSSKTTGVKNVYLKALVNGVEVVNGDINVNVDKKGTIISYGSSLPDIAQKRNEGNTETTRSIQLSETTQMKKWTASQIEAVKALAKYLHQPIGDDVVLKMKPAATTDDPATVYEIKGVPFAKKDVRVQQSYLQDADGWVVACWDIALRASRDYYHAQVSADGNNTVLQLINWASHAEYTAIPYRDTDPSDGFKLNLDPQDVGAASPLGWHAISKKKKFTTTEGNNAVVVDGRYIFDGISHFADGTPLLVFDFPFQQKLDPGFSVNASITQLFYMINIVHLFCLFN